ncbi:unnamed protein product [Tuwongella immobilis]|uniref:Uncharacterized protein n=1 Tax=Tuwongella immobilis TaxID=692036 RepID=A0A6C2YMV5_9BACT|nr:unnamed protein product [Tuwongella immobilis]VTS02908.1 unnamed protein product [Tuwongella immobilis]
MHQRRNCLLIRRHENRSTMRTLHGILQRVRCAVIQIQGRIVIAWMTICRERDDGMPTARSATGTSIEDWRIESCRPFSRSLKHKWCLEMIGTPTSQTRQTLHIMRRIPKVSHGTRSMDGELLAQGENRFQREGSDPCPTEGRHPGEAGAVEFALVGQWPFAHDSEPDGDR